ncbi:hypothetical protein BS50DRAFT_580946 [Corynespora cassiicola Philippines]|uniref:RING-type domain-containing protein n=1 Tax=Corynespora cassiicola Philippines TaxID=1448308 RepID=A0A2T2P8X5_CORCC|nr:hypothetical protein BS50DRAFT_580946 [Corynespora cassiicola Philippines]
MSSPTRTDSSDDLPASTSPSDPTYPPSLGINHGLVQAPPYDPDEDVDLYVDLPQSSSYSDNTSDISNTDTDTDTDPPLYHDIKGILASDEAIDCLARETRFVRPDAIPQGHDECPICMRPFDNGRAEREDPGEWCAFPVRTRCGHVFGLSCLYRDLTCRGKQCGMCRRELDGVVVVVVRGWNCDWEEEEEVGGGSVREGRRLVEERLEVEDWAEEECEAESRPPDGSVMMTLGDEW